MAQAHLKQPLGSRDGYRTRQRGGSGLKSSTGGSRSGSSAMARAGGVLHQRVNKGPHRTRTTQAALSCAVLWCSAGAAVSWGDLPAVRYGRALGSPTRDPAQEGCQSRP